MNTLPDRGGLTDRGGLPGRGGPAVAFKDFKLFLFLARGKLHHRMIEVFHFTADYFLFIFHHTPVVTSLFREPVEGESGVHGTVPLRAVDLSVSGLTEAQVSQFEADCNKAWIYDPERPEMRVCIRHDVGRGDHFHLQVHDRTVRRVGNV